MGTKHLSNILKFIFIASTGIICIAIIMLTALSYSASVELISPKGHQAIKAKVLNEDPAYFTINVKNLANWGANDEAETFAVYTADRLPKQCGNFLHLHLKYIKITKYHRQFDLSRHAEVIEAIHDYKCVVIRNIEPQ